MSDTQADLLIYGVPASPFVRKVLAFAIAKGQAFDLEPISPMNMTDDYAAISPMKRIPALRIRSIAAEGPGGTIADSSAICGYLEKQNPEPALYPSEPYAYGRALFFEEYADTVVAPATGMDIFRPIFFAIMQGNAPDLDTAKKTWSETLPTILAYLESSLSESDYLASDALSIADIAVTCCFMQAKLVANTPLDSYPAFAAHQERMQAHPAIAQPFAMADDFIRKALPERFDLA